MCIFLGKNGFERGFFSLVYFMQNREDRFQDFLGGVQLNSECTLSSSNWTSRPKRNLRVRTRQKSFHMTETFHRMLKCNFLHNVMVNYIFLSYEYIFKFIVHSICVYIGLEDMKTAVCP